MPLRGLIGKDHFGELVEIKDPEEDKNDTMEAQNDVQENDDMSLGNDEFGIYDILD